MSKKWKAPAWMWAYGSLIGNTGGNAIEELVNAKIDPRTNEVLFLIQHGVKCQVALLERLRKAGALNKVKKP